MPDLASLRERIEQERIGSIDFRLVDLTGRLRHITMPASRLSESIISNGFGFDGSNYGYLGAAGSDMVLVPDLSTAFVEERDGERVLSFISCIHETDTGKPSGIDPRRTTMAAVEYADQLGIADGVLVSPEFEFYVFDAVKFASAAGRTYVEVIPATACEHAPMCDQDGNRSSAYHSPLPQDRLFSLRCEIVRQIEAAGIAVKYHHHEAGRFGQQEIELGFDTLVRMADTTLVVKSLVQGVSRECGMTATFLPKPLHGQAGNGMHLHQYLLQKDRNLFCDGDGLSELALCYVGGLLTHGPSLMALTNPSTNSYRRLVPGYEAPVSFVYGASNRTAAVRIPAYAHGADTRIELRTMDATCNPYIAFAAILMAGIDGIQRGLNAKEMGFGSSQEPMAVGKTAPRDLDQALDALENDRDYLLAGGVFANETLEQWIRVKREETAAISVRPHPHEFTMYYEL